MRKTTAPAYMYDAQPHSDITYATIIGTLANKQPGASNRGHPGNRPYANRPKRSNMHVVMPLDPNAPSIEIMDTISTNTESEMMPVIWQDTFVPIGWRGIGFGAACAALGILLTAVVAVPLALSVKKGTTPAPITAPPPCRVCPEPPKPPPVRAIYVRDPTLEENIDYTSNSSTSAAINIVSFRTKIINQGSSVGSWNPFLVKMYKGTYWFHFSACLKANKALELTLIYDDARSNVTYVLGYANGNQVTNYVSILDALYTVADSDNEALMWMMTKNEMCQGNSPLTSWMAVKLEEVVSPLVTMQFTIRWPETGINGLVNLDVPDKFMGFYTYDAKHLIIPHKGHYIFTLRLLTSVATTTSVSIVAGVNADHCRLLATPPVVSSGNNINSTNGSNPPPSTNPSMAPLSITCLLHLERNAPFALEINSTKNDNPAAKSLERQVRLFGLYYAHEGRSREVSFVQNCTVAFTQPPPKKRGGPSRWKGFEDEDYNPFGYGGMGMMYYPTKPVTTWSCKNLLTSNSPSFFNPSSGFRVPEAGDYYVAAEVAVIQANKPVRAYLTTANGDKMSLSVNGESAKKSGLFNVKRGDPIGVDIESKQDLEKNPVTLAATLTAFLLIPS